MFGKQSLKPVLRLVRAAEGDRRSRQTAQALVTAHTNASGHVADEARLVDAIAAALIEARLAGRAEE